MRVTRFGGFEGRVGRVLRLNGPDCCLVEFPVALPLGRSFARRAFAFGNEHLEEVDPRELLVEEVMLR